MPDWGYGNRFLVEIILVVGIWGGLTYLAAEILPNYIINAKLSEPLQSVDVIKNQMLIDAAWTGELPSNDSLSHLKANFPSGIEDINISKQGSIEVSLAYDEPELHQRRLIFNLGTLESGNGIRFYSWYCGNSQPPQGYILGSAEKSTVDPRYTHTICRN